MSLEEMKPEQPLNFNDPSTKFGEKVGEDGNVVEMKPVETAEMSPEEVDELAGSLGIELPDDEQLAA